MHRIIKGFMLQVKELWSLIDFIGISHTRYRLCSREHQQVVFTTCDFNHSILTTFNSD